MDPVTATEPWKVTFVRAGILVAAGIAIGVGNNAIADKARALDWVGDYPDRPVRSAGRPAIDDPPDRSAWSEREGERDTDLVDVVMPADDPSVAFVEISSAQAKKAFDDAALFVDARRTAQFAEGHVEGAISVPIWEEGVDEKVADVLFRVEGRMSHAIVVYCNGGNCEDSHLLSEKLWDQGFSNVLVYADGYPDWLRRGGPTGEGVAEGTVR